MTRRIRFTAPVAVALAAALLVAACNGTATPATQQPTVAPPASAAATAAPPTTAPTLAPTATPEATLAPTPTAVATATAQAEAIDLGNFDGTAGRYAYSGFMNVEMDVDDGWGQADVADGYFDLVRGTPDAFTGGLTVNSFDGTVYSDACN